MNLSIQTDPFFVAVSSSSFGRADIADLAAGRCAAIRVPGAMDPALCAEIMATLSSVTFDAYDRRRVDPPVLRCGVGVSDFRVDGKVGDDYWRALAAHDRVWAGLGLPVDPFLACRRLLAENWPHPVRVATLGGRPMGAGVAREPNGGFQVHYDNAIREFSGNLTDENLVAQFAFNLYLSVPADGGETVVWRHRWSPEDESFRLPGSYGYAPEVVDGAESFELKPEVGEALLFDPRNFHAVRPSRGRRRVALGFSVGLADTGELVVWG